MFKDLAIVFEKVLCVAAVYVLCAGCGRNGPAEVDMKVDDADNIAEGTHVVQNNETIYDIAYQYSVNPQNLAKINGLKPPYKLWRGQVLQLPLEGDSTSAMDPRSIAVEKRYEGYGEYGSMAYRDDAVAASEGLSGTAKAAETKSEQAKSNGQKNQVEGKNSNSREVVVVSEQKIPSWEDDLDDPKARKKNAEKAEKSKDSAKELAVPKIVPTAAQSSAAKSDDSKGKTPKTAPEKPRGSSKMITPVKGRVISRFGDVNDGIPNDGINIKAAKGTSVVAAADGTVIYVGNKLDEEYGNVVIIQHKDGLITSYAHLDKAKVSKDTKVNAGDIIGTVGSTGDVIEPQLYFEVMKDKKPVNPSKYLK